MYFKCNYTYKLPHNDEVYWMNFSKKVLENNPQNIKDIYMFYIDFLPRENKFKKNFFETSRVPEAVSYFFRRNSL